MKAKDFDERFDSGEDIIKHLDLPKARRSEQEQRRVNVDFPSVARALSERAAIR